MRKITLMLFAFMISGISCIYAQKDVVNYFKAGNNTSTYIQNYIDPLLGSFGHNLNNGWYSTADPLNLGRFTISTGLSVSFIPSSKQTFAIGSTTASTMFGPNTSNGNIPNTSTPIPKGDGVALSPLPLLQGSVGLWQHTELMIRACPNIDIANYKVGYFGLGVKHDIKQWIPGWKKMPFSLSFIGTYTNSSLLLTDPELVDNKNNAQTLKYSASGWGANLIISRKFTVATVYGGLRLSHNSTDFNISGNFLTTNLNTFYQPKDLTFSDSGNQFGINAGIRLKAGFFAFNLDGVLAPGGYSSATLGLIFGIFN